ncbi:MAG: hypothetical protein ACREJO_00410 [Phycisphaerales bacterium]
MNGWLRNAAAACCALGFVGAAMRAGAPGAKDAQAALQPAESPSIGLVGLAPADSKIVIATRNFDEVLKQAEGSALADAVKRLGLLSSSETSVQQLAQQLGWTPPMVVDRLFGGVCMLAMLDDGEGKPWRWMLVSSITPDTAEQLGAKLQAVPADAVAGVPSLSIERGRYALIVRDRPAAMGDAGRSRRTRVIGLTPRGDGGALSELARTLVAGEGDTLAKRGVTATLKTLVPGHITVLVRSSAGPDKAMLWSSYTAVAARAARPAGGAGAAGAGWTADVVLADPAFAAALAAGAAPAVLPAPADDALASFSERRLPASVPWCLRLLETYDPSPAGAPGQRSLGVSAIENAGVAIQISSLAAPAPKGDTWADQHMSEVVAHLEGDPRPANACGGVAPEAVRTTALTLAPASMPRAALGAERTLSWRTRPAAAPTPGSAIVEAVLSPVAVAQVPWLSAPAAAPALPENWLASGWLRPAAIAKLLPQDLVTRLNVLGLGDLAGSCDRIEWSFRVDRESNPPVVRGRLEARPAAAR